MSKFKEFSESGRVESENDVKETVDELVDENSAVNEIMSKV